MMRRLLLALLLTFAGMASISGAMAIGNPQLATNCIKEAAKDFTLINDPAYVNPLQKIIDDIQDPRPIVFISCDAIDGFYAFRNDADTSIPPNNFIIYSPTFVRIATQQNPTKLLFLLAHEFAHFTLSHFTDQKNLSTYKKELQADTQAACIVARQTGDMNSLLQIIAGLRSDDGGGEYPSKADSEAAIRTSWEKCAKEPPPTPGNSGSIRSIPHSRVTLISPSEITEASVNRSIQWLSSQLMRAGVRDLRDLKLKKPESNSPDIASLADIEGMWGDDDSLFLVVDDSSDGAGSQGPAGPTFTGLFYLGPYGPGGETVVLQLGTADDFTASVVNAARENVRLTDKISAVALGFAALKYGLDTKQPKEVMKKFVAMAKFALTDLREQSDKVSDFADWTASLAVVDELISKWDS